MAVGALQGKAAALVPGFNWTPSFCPCGEAELRTKKSFRCSQRCCPIHKTNKYRYFGWLQKKKKSLKQTWTLTNSQNLHQAPLNDSARGEKLFFFFFSHINITQMQSVHNCFLSTFVGDKKLKLLCKRVIKSQRVSHLLNMPSRCWQSYSSHFGLGLHQEGGSK